MANGDIDELTRAIQAETDARVEEINAQRKVADALQYLRDAFDNSCRETEDTAQELKRIHEQLMEIASGMRAILLYLAADSAEERKTAARYREQINGLIFGENREKNMPMSSAQIRRELTDRVDEEELKTLCFDWGIDYDNLPGNGKAAKVRELVALEQRRDGVGRLRQWLETQKAPGG